MSKTTQDTIQSNIFKNKMGNVRFVTMNETMYSIRTSVLWNNMISSLRYNNNYYDRDFPLNINDVETFVIVDNSIRNSIRKGRDSDVL